MKKSVISYILTICMVVTMMPTFAFASSDAPAKDVTNITKESVSVTDAGEHENAKELAEPVSGKSAPKATAKKATTKSSSYVAESAGYWYYTLQEAIDDAYKGDTINLLTDLNESIYIDKEIILDLNGNCLYSTDATDVITIAADNVTVEHGYVENINYYPDDHATAFYIYDCSDVTIENVEVMTVGGSAVDETSSGFYIGKDAFATIINCQVYCDEDYVSSYDWIHGAYIADGFAEFIDCEFEMLYGSACYVKGDASLENCYFTADEDGSSAIDVMGNETIVTVIGGYYYGDSAVYISNNCKGYVMIIEGEFHSAYSKKSAFSGKKSCAEEYGFNGMNVIASPTNWKTSSTANHVFIYEGVAAPKTASTVLTGYDDIKFTWGKAYQTDFMSENGQKQADGYKVSFKKGTNDYGSTKVYKNTATRARTVTNLSDGYKYTFKVTPYVLINENLFGVNKATKCYSNKYKTAYTYTLKKVVLNKFSKSNNKVKVTWKNINGETGYQISKSTKKSGTNIVATYKTTTGTSKLISANKGKTYWYKVRAYKVVGDKKIYGPWSTPKSFKR